MSELRQQFENLGLLGVETFIASGNVIFESDKVLLDQLETDISSMLSQTYGFNVETYIRAPQVIATILAASPFPPHKVESRHSLYACFFPTPLSPSAIEATLSLQNDENDFHFIDNNLLWLNQKNQLETSITQVQMEKATGTKMTARNINTLARMIAKHPPNSTTP